MSIKKSRPSWLNVSPKRVAEIHAGVERIYEEGKEQERAMDEQVSQVSQVSELHKEYDSLYGHADPTDESPPYWYWLETKVAALEAKLSKMERLRRYLCSCGFTDFDEAEAHHPDCKYREALAGDDDK